MRDCGSSRDPEGVGGNEVDGVRVSGGGWFFLPFLAFGESFLRRVALPGPEDGMSEKSAHFLYFKLFKRF